MKRKWSNYFVLIIFGLIFLIYWPYYFVQCKKEYQSEYGFKVTKIDITDKKTLVLYNEEGKKMRTWNYLIFHTKNIKVGDSIHKGACSKYIYIFRKKNKVYRQIGKQHPTGLLPHEWVCQ